MQRARLVVCVLLLLSLAPVGAAQTVPETDNTVTRIDVARDGDAQWTVRVRTRLNSDEDVTSYRAFQERVRANESRFLDPFRTRIEGVVTTANEGTERSMAARNFSLSTSTQQVPRRWGVLEYSFTWSGFARTDGDAVVVDSVFGGGLFIARNDTLVLSGPAGYEATQVTPEPTTADNGTVSWQGPREFDADAPSVRYAPAQSSDGQFGDIAIAAVVVALLLGGGYVVYQRERGTAGADPGEAPIQTDADRVVALLAENGGQMKQTAIAAELDWSPSKTSRTLSDLADEDRIEKLRLGRENVISLPDSDKQ